MTLCTSSVMGVTRKPACRRQGALDPRRQVGPGDQLVAHPGGHLGLDGRIAGQGGHRAHVGIGVQQLVATEHHEHRHHGEQAGQHHQHPRRTPPDPSADPFWPPLVASAARSASFSRCSSSTVWCSDSTSSSAGRDGSGPFGLVGRHRVTVTGALHRGRDRSGPATVAVSARWPGRDDGRPRGLSGTAGRLSVAYLVATPGRGRQSGQLSSLAFWASNSASVMTPWAFRSASLASWSALLDPSPPPASRSRRTPSAAARPTARPARACCRPGRSGR